MIQKLALAYDRARSLTSLVTTAAVTLLMAFITVRLALAGGWFEAFVAGVLTLLGIITVTQWYRRLRS
jgi:CHASE2 domain-containing sensor protein